MKIMRTLNTFIVIGCLAIGSAMVGVTGCSSDRTHESSAEAAADDNISSRVVAALAATSDYKYSDVQVNTFKCRVQLSGFVDSSDHKDKAETVAKQVDGVKEVINNITVK
jgi:osmotically-inducible protein OsmY